MSILYHIHDKNNFDLSQGYVGVSFYDNRINIHKRKLMKNSHKNKKLQEAYNSFELCFDVIFRGPEQFCYEMERFLRPKNNMSWNLKPGGQRMTACAIRKPKKKVFNSEDRLKILKLNGYKSGIKSKINKTGIHKDGFNKNLANKRAKAGNLPAQISVKNGTHHWFSDNHKRLISERNRLNFSGLVSVCDLNGNFYRVSKQEFENQKIGIIETWKYVGNSSKEAKRRRKMSNQLKSGNS